MSVLLQTKVTLAICILPIGVVAALLYYPVACLIRWRYQRTPYADTLSEYQKQIQHKLHPGPDADHPKNQGLLASTLYELWKHFESLLTVESQVVGSSLGNVLDVAFIEPLRLYDHNPHLASQDYVVSPRQFSVFSWDHL